MMEFEPFRLRLASPVETAHGTIETRRGFLVTVEHEGVEGVGEATPLPGWTETYGDCRSALDRGQRIATELDWGIALAKVDEPAARHGLSLALADARARSADEPLYRYLGDDRHVPSVPVNATIDASGNPDDVARRARELSAEGYSCLKLKVGAGNVEEDIERVRAVRNAVGNDIELRVDANGVWTVETARDALEAFEVLGVEYVEQPLPGAALEEHAELRGSSVGIALDESLVTHDVPEVIEADVADALVIKPMVVGGPDGAHEASRQCRNAGIEPVVSTSIDAVVARTAAVHVAASIPDVRPCGLATAGMLATDLGPDPAPVDGGRIHVPQGNGLGLVERPT